MMKPLLFYLVIINALAFLLMLIDKHNAKTNRWRIRESVLLGVCAIGGSVGSLLGMYLLRHKTKHTQFAVGMPLMFLTHLAVLYFLREFLR